MLFAGINDNYKFKRLERELDENSYKGYWYDQTKVSNDSCTIHAPAVVLSNIFDKQISTEQLQAIWQSALNNGAIEGKGRYTSAGLKKMRQWWNENMETPNVDIYKFEVGDSDFDEVLNKGYGVIVSYKGTQILGENIRNDDKLTKDETVKGEFTYGHVTVIYKDGDGYKIVDSFVKWNGDNIRKIEDNETLQNLKEKGVFYNNAYTLLPKHNDMDGKEEQNLEALLYNMKVYYNYGNDEEVKQKATELADIVRDKLGIEK